MRATSRQLSKLPSIWMMSAPCATAWDILPMEILPSGTSTAQRIPACFAYAAADAEVLPVDAQTTALAPSSLALVMAMVIPRSLKEPVGFMPSNFSHTAEPVSSESARARISGVPPSPMVTTSVCSVTGSRSLYSLMTPFQTCAMRRSPRFDSLLPRGALPLGGRAPELILRLPPE